MANIHFIWWGACPAPDNANRRLCLDTPRAASGIAGHQIFFWCQEAFAVAFRQALSGTRVQVRGVESLLAEFGGATGSDEDIRWLEQADAVMTTLNAARAYSANKDLLELVVLLTHGGLYLDTTTVVNNPNTLAAALTELSASGQPRVPQIGDERDEGVRVQVGLQTPVAVVVGEDQSAIGYESVMLPHIDVWALYSNARDPAMRWMLQSYVSRANRVGLYPGATGTVQLGWVGEMTGSQILSGPDRQSLIGQLPVRAAYDGLAFSAMEREQPDSETSEQSFQALMDTTFKQMVWKTVAGNGGFVVSDLGITKVHAGTWRTIVPEGAP